MKMAVAALALVTLVASAQDPNMGTICGMVLNEKGEPASRVLVTAVYLGAHSGGYPATRTDENGGYCLTRVPFGENAPAVEDPGLGYPAPWASFYSAGPISDNAVTLSLEHPHATKNFRIPFKAAFLAVLVTDAQTGAPVSGMLYRLEAAADPERRFLFWQPERHPAAPPAAQ
jgi:hypothetical protein